RRCPDRLKHGERGDGRDLLGTRDVAQLRAALPDSARAWAPNLDLRVLSRVIPTYVGSGAGLRRIARINLVGPILRPRVSARRNGAERWDDRYVAEPAG